MKFFLDEEDEIEIQPVSDSADKAIVKHPGAIVGTPKVKNSEEVKEQAVSDAEIMGIAEAAQLHGVSESSIEKWGTGQNMKPETKFNIIMRKNDIQDVATAKLMDTLNLLNPDVPMKIKDRLHMADTLSKVTQRMDPKSDADRKGNVTVQVVAYCPVQKKITEYEVIDV